MLALKDVWILIRIAVSIFAAYSTSYNKGEVYEKTVPESRSGLYVGC